MSDGSQEQDMNDQSFIKSERRMKPPEPQQLPHTEPIVAMPISKLVEMIQAICVQGSQEGQPFWLDPGKTLCLAGNFLVPLQRLIFLS